MESGGQGVKVFPNNVSFLFELNRELFSTISLYNPTEKRVAFKVKTTSPDKYCVRPCTGVLDPENSLDLQVILRAFDTIPDDIEGCFDKFLVQSTAVEPRETMVTPITFDGSSFIFETLLNVTMTLRDNPVLLGRFLESVDEHDDPIERNEETVTEFKPWPQGSTRRSPRPLHERYHTLDEEGFKQFVENDINREISKGRNRDELEQRVARLEQAFRKAEADPRPLHSRGVTGGDGESEDGLSPKYTTFRKGPVIKMKPWYFIFILSAGFFLGRFTFR